MRTIKFNAPGLLTILVVLCAWEIVVRAGVVKFDYLPAPSGIFVAWGSLIVSGEMLLQTIHTIQSIAIGWSVAAAIGIGLGLLLGLSLFIRRWSLTSFELLRPLPAIAFLPLALLLFNFSLTTELVLMIYASIWPVFINTMGGVMGVTPRLYDVGRTLRLSRMQTLVKIIIPAAAPAIVTGCRLSLGLTLVMAIIAEMIANPHGLGYAVISELQAMQPQRMFAYVLYIGLLSIGLNAALLWISSYILRGHRWINASEA
jgi:ABC-type nitrate/sulfonate/bicarbonate transport system permease component